MDHYKYCFMKLFTKVLFTRQGDVAAEESKTRRIKENKGNCEGLHSYDEIRRHEMRKIERIAAAFLNVDASGLWFQSEKAAIKVIPCGQGFAGHHPKTRRDAYNKHHKISAITITHK